MSIDSMKFAAAPDSNPREATTERAPSGRGSHLRAPWFFLALCALFLGGQVAAQVRPRPGGPAPVTVSDRFFWDQTTTGMEITGKFNSTELMARTFNLLQPVGTYQQRRLRLADILFLLDLNANGDVARWIVVGPRAVVTSYVEALRRSAQNRSVFYDFSVTPRRVVPCCAD